MSDLPSSVPSASDLPIVVFIGPFGFSGSTLLDTALAQGPELVTLGEAFQIADWVRENRLCTCKSPIHECSFWPGVLERIDAAALARPSILSGRHDYFAGPVPDTAETRAYARAHWAMIDAAAKAAGARFVIDSSKHLWRLRALALEHPERIRFLQLVRDCAVVARSAATEKASPAVGESARTIAVPYPRTVAKWVATNIASTQFCKRMGIPRRAVSYARFTGEPEGELRAICAWLGTEFDPAMLHPSMEGLHNVAGSRWRMTRRQVEIKAGDREALPWYDRSVSSAASRIVALF